MANSSKSSNAMPSTFSTVPICSCFGLRVESVLGQRFSVQGLGFRVRVQELVRIHGLGDSGSWLRGLEERVVQRITAREFGWPSMTI